MPIKLSYTKIQQIIKPTKTNDFCYWMKYNGVVIDNYYSVKNDRVCPRNAIITDCMANPWYCKDGKQNRHNQSSYNTIYMYNSSSFSFQCE